LLEAETSWSFLEEIRRDLGPGVPIIVVTMVENEKRARALGADAFSLKPTDRSWLLATLDELTRVKPQRRALIIDDDEISRYILRGMLVELGFVVFEAKGGREGLDLAARSRPDVVFLDL